MTALTSFDKNSLQNVRAALDAALESVEKEFGIKLKVGGIKFTADSFKAELSAMIGGDDPMLKGVDPKYVGELTKYRDYNHWYKMEITIGGEIFTILGAKPRTRLEQIIVRRKKDNVLRVISNSDIERALKASAK